MIMASHSEAGAEKVKPEDWTIKTEWLDRYRTCSNLETSMTIWISMLSSTYPLPRPLLSWAIHREAQASLNGNHEEVVDFEDNTLTFFQDDKQDLPAARTGYCMWQLASGMLRWRPRRWTQGPRWMIFPYPSSRHQECLGTESSSRPSRCPILKVLPYLLLTLLTSN